MSPDFCQGSCHVARVELEGGDSDLAQTHSSGDSELGLHQIDAGDLLGDGVLDLDPGIALDEIVLASLGRHQELHRGRVHQVGRSCEPHGIGVQSSAQLISKTQRRSDLDDLLVALLDRAIPFMQMCHVPTEVGEHLHLDVAWSVHETLDEHGSVTERCGGFARAPFERLGNVLDAPHSAHASATAACCGLEHHRQSDLGGSVGCGSRVGDCPR